MLVSTRLCAVACLGLAQLVGVGRAASAAGIIVFSGDSHTNGTGADRSHAWPVQVMTSLNRPDIAYLNVARGGGTMAEQVAGWRQYVQARLAAATGPKIVFAMGGYNDIGRYAATADTVMGLFRDEARYAHAAGAIFICGVDVLRHDASGRLNPVVQQISQMIRADRTDCDAIVDFQRNPIFDQPSGPYPAPPFTAQDHGVHLDNQGQTMMAEMATPVFARALQDGTGRPGSAPFSPE